MGKFAVGAENGLPIELHYTDHGQGQPVVLIHGWPLSGRSWESQEPALIEAGYRVINYDRRGFGQSSQPWDGYDFDTLTADLAALVDHLDLRDAVLIGFSMGGGEVVRYLSRYGSDRVSKVVLASAVPPYLFKSDDNPDGGIDDARIVELVSGVQQDRMAFFDEYLDSYFSAGTTIKVSPQQKAYTLSLLAVASPKATIDCIHAFSRTDFREDLTKVTVPTLVIHGDSDSIVPIEVSGQRAAAAIRGSVLVTLEDAPHGILVSHPQEWNAAVLQFLRG
ncbi:MAG TPA: alpha/beta hydrolase [Propionibacteriaceae bacterium]|jgi:pimeloyl-ACP methyl ester carboxylesterase|nr:alpha/beta hydrolase [Propionibacteriaceae bacterium]